MIEDSRHYDKSSGGCWRTPEEQARYELGEEAAAECTVDSFGGRTIVEHMSLESDRREPGAKFWDWFGKDLGSQARVVNFIYLI